MSTRDREVTADYQGGRSIVEFRCACGWRGDDWKDLEHHLRAHGTGAVVITPENRAPAADDGACEHGFAADVHCCECNRSGFFPPVDCTCIDSDVEALKGRVLALPRRLEHLGGQTFSYVKLDDVLALMEGAAQPTGEDARRPIRAHVEGCRFALSVPVDLCACGGRDFLPKQGAGEDAAPPQSGESR